MKTISDKPWSLMPPHGPLTLLRVALDTVRVDFDQDGAPELGVDPPLEVLLSGPYDDGSFVAAVPELGLAMQGPSAAHALGQVDGMVAAALAHRMADLSAKGRMVRQALRARRVADDNDAV
jgi:hypothetical protein